MDCVNCGAALPPKSNICKFCDTVNDVDVRAISRHADTGPKTNNNCPRCGESFHHVKLDVEGTMHIEQCAGCMGIFFDPGELEAVLNNAVSEIQTVDFQKLSDLTETGYQTAPQSGYIACPVCGKMMNRKNYGSRSNVIVDICRDDGVWLDGGELNNLIRWASAGGHILTEQRQRERERREERQERLARAEEDMRKAARMRASPSGGLGVGFGGVLPGILKSIINLLD